MARIFLTIALCLAFSPAGNPQMKPAADIGIDEKLGMQVALDIVLKDENGNDITLRQLVDKPTILMFNYFRCPGICPVLINSMVEVVNQIQLEPGKDFRLIAVSFDPTDTPELARAEKGQLPEPDEKAILTGRMAFSDGQRGKYQERLPIRRDSTIASRGTCTSIPGPSWCSRQKESSAGICTAPAFFLRMWQWRSRRRPAARCARRFRRCCPSATPTIPKAGRMFSA